MTTIICGLFKDKKWMLDFPYLAASIEQDVPWIAESHRFIFLAYSSLIECSEIAAASLLQFLFARQPLINSRWNRQTEYLFDGGHG